ncbi:hypothetical protein MICRO8M_90080 [Microbacterium sp. 8M]|uniref:hypothetical protein n=1 Tax=Microbacterium sp. 8M TaxID=2653153 RepID=UPI0012F1FD40|nr:hypothetical protein [Microbacterium sp. 8M]VXC31813.1 hypothetical protein MICRO8M_90080 [Microbacterium sp. 8M]
MPSHCDRASWLVVYIEEEARDWYENVADYSDPLPYDEFMNRMQPYTPAPTR